MRVQEIMTQDVACVSRQTNAATAAEIMWMRNCGALPIVEDGGRLVGAVTDRDLFIALGTQNRMPAELQMEAVMRSGPFFCEQGDDVRQALKTMAREKIHRLPVVDESRTLKGILSIDDVLARTDSLLKEDAIRTIKAISEHQINTRPEPLIVEASD